MNISTRQVSGTRLDSRDWDDLWLLCSESWEPLQKRLLYGYLVALYKYPKRLTWHYAVYSFSASQTQDVDLSAACTIILLQLT